MATLEDVQNEWKKDTIIDATKLNSEIVRVPLLHSKYLDYLIYFRAKRTSALRKLNEMKNVKRRYYRGELNQIELTQHGWHQWQGLKPAAGELNQLFEQDPDLNELEGNLEYYSTSLHAIEYIMKEIHSRGYNLKTIFEYEKFINGG